MNGAATFAGRRPLSFTWELDWRLRQEPVRNENRYRSFLSPAVDVERQHSGDNGGVSPRPILHRMPSQPAVVTAGHERHDPPVRPNDLKARAELLSPTTKHFAGSLTPLGEGDGNFVDEVAGGEAALSFES